MPIIRRINAVGLTYIISANPGDLNRTTISFQGKKIEVAHNFEKINQAWFDWQQKGEYIQKAFHFLNDDEREFLMTGITPEEWKELFPKGDDE